uniref:DNA-(apurinic or apyrimidinic site) endonuclease n=1 Tax=Eutreptiella gymnastica TaxID=73025 RepID=A0A7S1N644_9EUGL|mmetsp:Transcript_127976/g.221142  ORF Transcript_127976/g.221142 Transcript_127976/m.221142 type:complete len:240 (+) Transcript_127976:2-721(+)
MSCSRTSSPHTPPDDPPTSPGTTQFGTMVINLNGRKTRQEEVARALLRAPRPPDFVICIETRTRKGAKTPPWDDYTVAAHNYQTRLPNRGIEVYKHKLTPCRVTVEMASKTGDALMVRIYTSNTNFGIVVPHAPHTQKVKRMGYYMYWLRFWARVRKCMDVNRIIMMGDVNSAYRTKDRHKERPDDILYRRMCQVLGLQDLSSVVELPENTWSCMQGGGSRIDTAAISEESAIHICDAT